jgi:hypothetical protein
MYVGHCTFFTDGREWDDVQSVGILFSSDVANYPPENEIYCTQILFQDYPLQLLCLLEQDIYILTCMLKDLVLSSSHIEPDFIVLGIFLCYLDCLIMSFTINKVRSQDFSKYWYFFTISSSHSCQHISICLISLAYLCEQGLFITALNCNKEVKLLLQIGFQLILYFCVIFFYSFFFHALCILFKILTWNRLKKLIPTAVKLQSIIYNCLQELTT